MPKISVLAHASICPQGASFEAPTGERICQALLDQRIAIEHACGQACACTTCHVIIHDGFDSLSAPTENEEDLLDRAWGVTVQSRLACQACIGSEDLTIEIPRYSLNHAKE